jgi:osmotically inducible protein OsmC
MPVRNAQARWEGDLKGGSGTMRLGSGAYEGKYSFGSRFEEDPGANPEVSRKIRVRIRKS